MSDNEEALFYSLAMRMGWSQEQAGFIWTEKATYKLRLPSSEWERIEYMHMSMMMAVGGAFENRERNVVKQLGA